MMSIGCYNFLEKKWEVGPDIKEKGFDPIVHFYNKSIKIAYKVIE